MNDKNMIFIGIDPGAKGGLAYLINGEANVRPFSPEFLISMCDIIKSCTGARAVCCIEQVHAMPGQGVTSMFNFGQNFGYIKGVLEAYRIPYQETPPQTWKKEFSLNGEKSRSIEVCKRLFPDVSLLATERSRKDHDGMAEALLMAEYAKRHFR